MVHFVMDPSLSLQQNHPSTCLDQTAEGPSFGFHFLFSLTLALWLECYRVHDVFSNQCAKIALITLSFCHHRILQFHVLACS